jgi:hypothetical protein
MSTPTIRRCSHSEILCAVNATELIAEYAAECSVPGAQPQVKMYAAMEEAGVLQCIGAWVRRDHPFESETLVGFINVLNTLMPHNGQRVATVESFFVTGGERSTGAGNALLHAADVYATECGCFALLNTARIGSRLHKVLSHRAGSKATHTVFTSWL